MPGHLQRPCGRATIVALNVYLSAAPDFQVQPFGKGIDDRNANAVQSAGNFVGGVIELSAGMQLRENNFGRRLAFFRHDFCGNTATVIDDSYGIIDMNDNVNFGTESRKSFVNRVVDDFVNEVVQSIDSRRTDVHGGPLANRLQSLQNFDVFRSVVRFGRGQLRSPSDAGNSTRSVIYQSPVLSVSA